MNSTNDPYLEHSTDIIQGLGEWTSFAVCQETGRFAYASFGTITLIDLKPIEFNRAPVPLLQIESTFFVSKISLFYDIIAFSSPSEVKVLKLSTTSDFKTMSRSNFFDEPSSPYENSVSIVEDFSKLVGSSSTFNPYLTIPFTSAPLRSPDKVSNPIKFPSIISNNYNVRLLVISTNKNDKYLNFFSYLKKNDKCSNFIDINEASNGDWILIENLNSSPNYSSEHNSVEILVDSFLRPSFHHKIIGLSPLIKDSSFPNHSGLLNRHTSNPFELKGEWIESSIKIKLSKCVALIEPTKLLFSRRFLTSDDVRTIELIPQPLIILPGSQDFNINEYQIRFLIGTVHQAYLYSLLENCLLLSTYVFKSDLLKLEINLTRNLMFVLTEDGIEAYVLWLRTFPPINPLNGSPNLLWSYQYKESKTRGFNNVWRKRVYNCRVEQLISSGNSIILVPESIYGDRNCNDDGCEFEVRTYSVPIKPESSLPIRRPSEMKHPSSLLSPGGDVLRPNNNAKSASRSVTSASSRTQSMRSSPLSLTPTLQESRSSNKLHSLENENTTVLDSIKKSLPNGIKRKSNFIEILTLPSPNLLIKHLFSQSNELLFESLFLTLYIKAIFSQFNKLIDRTSESLNYWPNILTISNSNFYLQSNCLNLCDILFSIVEFKTLNSSYLNNFCKEILTLNDGANKFKFLPSLRSIFKINLATAEKILISQSFRLGEFYFENSLYQIAAQLFAYAEANPLNILKKFWSSIGSDSARNRGISVDSRVTFKHLNAIQLNEKSIEIANCLTWFLNYILSKPVFFVHLKNRTLVESIMYHFRLFDFVNFSKKFITSQLFWTDVNPEIILDHIDYVLAVAAVEQRIINSTFHFYLEILPSSHLTLLNSSFIPEIIDLGAAYSFFENRNFTDTITSTPINHSISNIETSTPSIFTNSPLADLPSDNLVSTPVLSRTKSINNTPASAAAHKRLREQFRKNKLMNSPSIVSPKSETQTLSNSLSSNSINNIAVTSNFDFQETASFRPKYLDLFARGILCFKLNRIDESLESFKAMETKQLIECITEMPKLLLDWGSAKSFNSLLRSHYPFVLMNVLLNWIQDSIVCHQFNLSLLLALKILNSNHDYNFNDPIFDEATDISVTSCNCRCFDTITLFNSCGISNNMDFKPISYSEENILILDITKKMEAYMLTECFLANLVCKTDVRYWNDLTFESFKRLVTIELLRLSCLEYSLDEYGFCLQLNPQDYKNYCELIKCPELSNGWLDASQLIFSEFLSNYKSNYPLIVNDTPSWTLNFDSGAQLLISLNSSITGNNIINLIRKVLYYQTFLKINYSLSHYLSHIFEEISNFTLASIEFNSYLSSFKLFILPSLKKKTLLIKEVAKENIPVLIPIVKALCFDDSDLLFTLNILKEILESKTYCVVADEYSVAYSTLLHLVMEICGDDLTRFMKFLPSTPVCLRLFLPYLTRLTSKKKSLDYIAEMLSLVNDFETGENVSETWLSQQLAQL